MSPKKSFIILTNDCGFGHRSAANALQKAFSELYPSGTNAKVINPIDETKSHSFLHATETSYDRNVTDFPEIYRFTYGLSDSRRASLMIEKSMKMMLYRVMQNIIQKYQPDAIIVTNEMFNAPTGAAIKKIANGIPLFTVVTDFADVHSLWFSTYPDRFFVASQSVQQKAINCGIPSNKITISGIPVDPAFARSTRDISAQRKALGMDPDLPTLLFVGSRRVSGIYQYLQFVNTLNERFQVAVVTGGDDDLYSKVKTDSWRFPINCQKFVSNISEWMACADVLFTKAGGLILSEGLASGLPILLIDHLPGQEEGNVQFILENNAGIYVKDEWDLSQAIVPWLTGSTDRFNKLAEYSRLLGHPDAALTIAETVWSAVPDRRECINQKRPYARAD